MCRSYNQSDLLATKKSDITNLKSAFNFVLKLGSKRPEVSSKKFNDYIASNQVKVVKRSVVDAGLDDDFQPVAVTTKKNTLRSTPQQKQTIKKLVPKKLENFFIRAKIRSTTTYERTHKNRKTKLLQTYAHVVPNVQFVNSNIMASSKAEAEQMFTSDIQDSNDDSRPEYKQHTKIDLVDIVQSDSWLDVCLSIGCSYTAG